MAPLPGSSAPPLNYIELFGTIIRCSMLVPGPAGDSDFWCEWVRSLLVGLRWLIIFVFS